MRFLFLSNLLPPYGQGGYEEWCQEVAVGLRQRGNDVVVLTTRHGSADGRPADPDWVRRELFLEMELATLRSGLLFFTSRSRREEANLSTLRKIVDREAPDRILIWGMWNIPRSLPSLAELILPGKVAYYLGDYWPTLNPQYEAYWRATTQRRYATIPKKILGTVALRRLAREPLVPLRFDTVMVPSAFLGRELLDKGVPLKEVHLVPGGVDLHPYLSSAHKPARYQDGITLLTAGRLTPEKGIHTAIEALATLVNERGMVDLCLLIAGSGPDSYKNHLRQLADELGVADNIRWLGQQSKDTLATLYREADIFLFTSIWPEPFGRVIVEAMASGTAVVGARAGGAAELLADGQNSLTYTPGDAEELASQIDRLIHDDTLRAQISNCGRRRAIDSWDINHMTNAIEERLIAL